MSNFYARDGHFWLDDQPQLIQAGEFHYYRTPKDEWPHRLGLLKQAGFNTLASYIPWLWHQLEEGVSDFDGHSHPMRDLAGFLDLAAEMGLFIIPRPGPYIMAETINEGIPPWVFANYPQTAFISQEGKTQNIASYLHPEFLGCVSRWYRAIFSVLTPRQITRGGKIIMLQLDNEMGMIHWVRNIFDTNAHTLSHFAAHLHAAYGPQLSTRYPAEDLPAFLREGLMHPSAAYAEKIVEDYRRFFREYLREYTAFLLTEAKANGLEVPPVINIHGFANGGKTFPIGLSQLDSVMGLEGVVSATDVYPGFIGEGNFHQLLLVNEMTKALHNPQQALFSIEFQAGGNNDFSNGQSSLNDLHSRLCISSGMRAINHYLFCDGENDPLLSPVKRHDWGHPVRKDGSLRKHYFRYLQLSRVLSAYGADLIRARPQAVTTIGFQLDGFMTEVNNAFSQEAANILTHQREVILFDFIARGLALTHRPFEAVDLRHGALNPAQTPVLWVMMEKQCDAAVQQKLVDYARAGGKLILAGRMCAEDFQHAACTLLRDAIGIEHISGGEPFAPVIIHAFHYRDIPASFVEAYTGAFDEVFAARSDGAIVGFIKTVGAGRVMMLGAAMTANTLDDLGVFDQMALKMDCPALFRLSDWADVRLSRGERGSFLFINNYQDDPVETTLEYTEAYLLGGNTVRLPARRGLILPLDWQLREGVTINFITSEVVEVTDDGAALTLKTAQDEFFAEMTLTGYQCESVTLLKPFAGTRRIAVQGRAGMMVLRRE